MQPNNQHHADNHHLTHNHNFTNYYNHGNHNYDVRLYHAACYAVSHATMHFSHLDGLIGYNAVKNQMHTGLL